MPKKLGSPVAKRLTQFDSSKIRAAFEFAEEIPNPIDLSIGFPEDKTPDYIKNAGIAAIKHNRTRYTASNGLLELRQAIARKLERENGIRVSPKHVSVTPGITTGILLAYSAILDPGDEVILPDPFFPPYRDLAIMLGAKLKYADTFPSFQLKADLIEPLISAKTKVLVVNSPNNPTGAVYSKSELIKIANLAKKHGLIILSDEVYEHFTYNGSSFSIGSIYPNTLTLNGFSKSYAMTGWRIGYISGPAEIIEAVNELQQYMVFASSTIGQYAALAALKRTPRHLTDKYRAKRNYSKRILTRTFPSICGAQGAFYFFLKLPSEIKDLNFVNHVGHRGVIVLPGSAFSSRGDYVRISYAAENKKLEEGLRRICESVRIMNRVS